MAFAIFLLAALVAIVFLGTVTRYLNLPLLWTEELSSALFVWLAMLAADITLQRAGHFRIDALATLLPEPVQLVLDIVIKLMIAALLAALVWYGVALIKVAHPRPLPMLDVPSSLAAAALPVAYALMLITTIEQIIRRLSGQQVDAAAGRDVM
jgi:TRAP-type C4-dicarboxylate transport system permease small subunit